MHNTKTATPTALVAQRAKLTNTGLPLAPEDNEGATHNAFMFKLQKDPVEKCRTAHRLVLSPSQRRAGFMSSKGSS